MKHIFLTALLGLCTNFAGWAQTAATHETLTTDASKAAYVEPAYDLQGRSINDVENYRGIFVKDGKKNVRM